MKKNLKSSCLLVFVFCFSMIYPSLGVAGVDLPWSTTFNCSDWEQGEALDCDGLRPTGSSTCEGRKTQITSDANYSRGDDGKGVRFYVGDGWNVNSGCLLLAFNSPQPEIWVRWYMRYELGFQWSYFSYDKLLYFDLGQSPSFIAEFKYSDQLAIYTGTSYQSDPGTGWNTIMSGSTSDGEFHCYELHLKMDTNGTDGIAEMWIDGVLRLRHTNIAFSTASGWTFFHFHSNQDSPGNGRPMAVDYDDMAVSNTGYIGPINGDDSDTISPTISTTSPTQGQTVSGTITVSASASDNVGVAGVQFELDGADFGAEDTTSPYSISWDTTTVSDGPHSLAATARDAAGNQTTSTPVNVTVSNGGGPDTVPPSVSITSPSEGQTISGAVTISANASDNVGVAGVQFELDGADFGAEDTTSPYSISWDTTTVSDGPHSLAATARDAAGNQTTSTPVSVTISNDGSRGALLFEESFEDASFSSRGWYDNTNLRLSTTEHIPGSTSSVEFHFNQGASTPTSGGAIRKKFTDTDMIYVSYYVKYSSNWEGSNKSYHPHEFLILSDLDGNWDSLSHNYLATYIEQNEGEPLLAIQDGKNIDEGNVGSDLTGVTENRAVAGCNGDSDGHGDGSCYACGSVHCNGKKWRAGSVYFQDTTGSYYKNDWHFIEVFIKLNSISGGKGIADGVIKYWYDGNLIIDHTDVVLRTAQHPNMKFNQFIIAPWIGDGSPIDQTFWIDDLTVAIPTTTTISAPTGLRIIAAQ